MSYVQDLLRETLEDSKLRAEHAGGSQWTVHGGRWESRQPRHGEQRAGLAVT